MFIFINMSTLRYIFLLGGKNVAVYQGTSAKLIKKYNSDLILRT